MGGIHAAVGLIMRGFALTCGAQTLIVVKAFTTEVNGGMATGNAVPDFVIVADAVAVGCGFSADAAVVFSFAWPRIHDTSQGTVPTL